MATQDLTAFFNSSTKTTLNSKINKSCTIQEIPTETHPSPKDITFNLHNPDILHQQSLRILHQIIKLTNSKQLPPFLEKIETTGEIEAILLNDDLPKIKVTLSHLEFIKPLLNERFSKLLRQLLTRYDQTDTHLILTYFRYPQIHSIIEHGKNREFRGTSSQFYRLDEEILIANHLHTVGIRFSKDFIEIRSTLLSYL